MASFLDMANRVVDVANLDVDAAKDEVDTTITVRVCSIVLLVAIFSTVLVAVYAMVVHNGSAIFAELPVGAGIMVNSVEVLNLDFSWVASSLLAHISRAMTLEGMVRNFCSTAFMVRSNELRYFNSIVCEENKHLNKWIVYSDNPNFWFKTKL